MVRIRKKTSNRVSVRQREKIKKKVSDSKRKSRKEAKKDVTWKSKVKKDPGIPSLFPYKDQLLKEAKLAKERREEERKKKRLQPEPPSTLANSIISNHLQSSSNPQTTMDEDLDDDDLDFSSEEDSSPSSATTGKSKSQSKSLRAHARSLRKVIELSDVVVQVLDARDPLGSRMGDKVEREVLRNSTGVGMGNKKMVLVLNKIDLVPKENVISWLSYLRRFHPTLPFRSSTQSQRNNLSTSISNNNPEPSGGGGGGSSIQPLMTLLKSLGRSDSPSSSTPKNATDPKIKTSVTIGIIGFPNVGKSSLINTLKRSKSCPVAPTPGFTKQVQEVVLEKGVRVLDCPGVVLESGGNGGGGGNVKGKGKGKRKEGTGNVGEGLEVLRNVVKVEDIDDPVGPVEAILKRCKKEHLMMLYNIPDFITTTDFLVQVSRVRGRIKKGGLPDLAGAARSVLRDWQSNRIPYYTVPPTSSSTFPTTSSSTPSLLTANSSDIGQSSIVSSLAPEFDLDALFGKADEEALTGLKGVKEIGNGLVKMQGGEEKADDDVKIGWMGEEDEDDPDGDEAMGGSDEGESEEMEVDIHERTSHKRPGSPSLITGPQSRAPPPKKRVSFAEGTNLNNEPLPSSKADNQLSKIFGSGEDQPASIRNRAAKRKMKKDKKRRERGVGGAGVGEGDEDMVDG